MAIYIVIYKTDAGMFVKTKHRSFDDIDEAKDFSVNVANNIDLALKKIVRVDTDYRTMNDYELILDDGSFVLSPIKEVNHGK